MTSGATSERGDTRSDWEDLLHWTEMPLENSSPSVASLNPGQQYDLFPDKRAVPEAPTSALREH